MEAATPTVDARIDRLERSVRRLQLLTVALTLGLVAVLGARFAALPDQATPELRARRLVIVDDAGQTRLSLGQDPPINTRLSNT